MEMLTGNVLIMIWSFTPHQQYFSHFRIKTLKDYSKADSLRIEIRTGVLDNRSMQKMFLIFS